nr:MAG: hypothetical protein [Caudoviricetes sp.]
MRYLLLLLFPMLVSANDMRIIRIVDADTYIVSAPFLPDPLKKEMPLRLAGVDTPGVKRWANCDKENAKGEFAKHYVEGMVERAKTQQIKLQAIDKYGRLLGRVVLDGKDLSETLIRRNLGRKYDGEKKQSWCN